MIRNKGSFPERRGVTGGRAGRYACRTAAFGVWCFLSFLAGTTEGFADNPPPPAPPPPAAAPAAPAVPQLTVNNPFSPDGTSSSDQYVTRDELNKLLARQEDQLRKEMNGSNINTDEINKLIVNAAAGSASLNPDNFIGCMDGVPLYRNADGTLNLGDKEPDDIKKLRCEK